MDDYSLIDPLVNDGVQDSVAYTVITDKPTVVTDKSDYAPGEIATITGTGYAPNTTVEIVIADAPDDYGDDGDRDYYEPILVTVDEFGNFTTTWFVPTDNNGTGSGTPDALNATLNLMATGSDGQVATTTFTDGGITYYHWETIGAGQSGPQWANGQANPNQATYLEGDVVPHWLELTNLDPNKIYGIIVDFDYYQQNTNAGGQLYLDEYDTSITDVTPLRSTLIADSNYDFTANDPNPTAFTSPQLTFFFNNNLVNIIDVDYQTVASPTANTFRRAEIIFTTGNLTNATDDVNLYYGLRLALPGEAYEPVNNELVDGSAGFTGGSLQTKIEGDSFTPGTINTDPNINWITPSNAIQLQPGVVLRGLISGYKWNDINGNTQWDTGEVGIGGWTINLYKDTNNSNTYDSGDLLYSTAITSNGNQDVNEDGVNDPLGYYEFSSAAQPTKPLLRNDKFFVLETLQSGWTQTYPTTPNGTPDPTGSNYWGPLTITTTTPQFKGIFGAGSEDSTKAVGNFGNRFLGQPSLTIEKQVSVNGTTWLDADSPTGPVVIAGQNVYYRVVVTNTGNVNLTNIDVTDVVNTGGGSPQLYLWRHQ